MKYLEAFKLVLGLVPTLISAITAIEDALPEGGKGSLKLQAIKDLLQAGWETATDAVGKFDDAWPALQGAIAILVGLFNAAGKFKSKGAKS